jgi:hypothetical protein
LKAAPIFSQNYNGNLLTGHVPMRDRVIRNEKPKIRRRLGTISKKELMSSLSNLGIRLPNHPETKFPMRLMPGSSFSKKDLSKDVYFKARLTKTVIAPVLLK